MTSPNASNTSREASVLGRYRRATRLASAFAHDRATEEARAYMEEALAALREAPVGTCASPDLLRVVLGLSGSQAMERLARAPNCRVVFDRRIEEERRVFLALIGAGKHDEASLSAAKVLQMSREYLRNRHDDNTLFEVYLAMMPILEFFAVHGADSSLRSGIVAFLTRYQQQISQSVAISSVHASVRRGYLLKMSMVAGDLDRVRQLVDAERQPGSRRMLLMEVFAAACIQDLRPICSEAWLSGNGRHMMAQDEYFDASVWAIGQYARYMAVQGDTNGALRLLSRMPTGGLPGSHRERALACVARRLFHDDDMSRGMEILLEIQRTSFRAEALIFALSPMPREIRLRHAAVAMFERNGLEEQC